MALAVALAVALTVALAVALAVVLAGLTDSSEPQLLHQEAREVDEGRQSSWALVDPRIVEASAV